MVAYTLFIVVLAVYRGDANDVSILVSCCAVFGALFDAIESLGLLMMIEDPTDLNPLVPLGVTLLAVIKFVLLAIPIVYIFRPFKLPKSKGKAN
jgi:hypothetical protein